MSIWQCHVGNIRRRKKTLAEGKNKQTKITQVFLMLAIQYGNSIISSYDMSRRGFTLHDNIIRKRRKNLREVLENKENAFFTLSNNTFHPPPHIKQVLFLSWQDIIPVITGNKILWHSHKMNAQCQNHCSTASTPNFEKWPLPNRVPKVQYWQERLKSKWRMSPLTEVPFWQHSARGERNGIKAEKSTSTLISKKWMPVESS